MKKYLLSLPLFFLAFVNSVHAAPVFSHPILEKANEQIVLRIEQKTRSITLDENSKKSIEQKKKHLSEILVSVDEAFRKHDKTRFKEQAKLFRDGYKETMLFIQNLTNTSVSSNIHKNIPRAAGDAEITGKSTNITYYADSFE